MSQCTEEHFPNIKREVPLKDKLEFYVSIGTSPTSIPRLELSVSLQQYSYLEMKVHNIAAPTNEGLLTPLESSPLTGSVLSESEAEILTTYFNDKIAHPPYKKDYMSSFITSINLPFHVLKEVIHIMALEQKHEPVFQLYMNAGSILHDKNGIKVIIHIGITTKQSKTYRIVFHYYYTINKVELTSMHPEDSGISTLMMQIIHPARGIFEKVNALVKYL